MTIFSHTKIINKHHTGKLRPHKHTSYGSLILILMLVGVPIFFVNHSVAADNESYQPYSEQVSAVVPSPIPTVAPTISSPTNNQVFTASSPVSVQGHCSDNTTVEIFKNQVLAGSGECKGDAYDISIELFVGANSLSVQAYNADGIAGPDSAALNVRLLPPGSDFGATSQYNQSGTSNTQFSIAAKADYQGGKTSETITWPLIITGGTAPYIVEVSWGDGQTSTILQDTAGTFDISHDYGSDTDSKGTYPITIKASDQAGDTSYLQLVADLNHSKALGILGWFSHGFKSSEIVRLAWGLFSGTFIIVVSFWIGEKREIHTMRRRAIKAAANHV